MKKLILFEDAEEMENYSSQNDRIIVVYKAKVLDLTNFHTNHPGGDVFEDYNGYDIQEVLESKKIHKHS